MEYIDNNVVLKNLLAIKSQTDNIDEIRKIKNQINFIHSLLLTKDKVKKIIKTKNELESFIEMNKSILLGYQRKRCTDNPMYNVYIIHMYDLNLQMYYTAFR
jgi:t-SNARE complex subunit (syntaxin)